MPVTLQSLTLGETFNQRLQNMKLPSSLRSLTLGCHFNRDLDKAKLPGSIQSLTFGDQFNQTLDGFTLPDSLQTLTFGCGFDQSLDHVIFPHSLQNLTFGSKFSHSLEKVTLPNLRSLQLKDVLLTCWWRKMLPEWMEKDVAGQWLSWTQPTQSFDMFLISIVDSLPTTKTLICHGNLRGLKSSPNFGRETRPGLRPYTNVWAKVICQVFVVVLVNSQNAAAPEFAVLVVRPRIWRFFSLFFSLYIFVWWLHHPFSVRHFPWNQSFHQKNWLVSNMFYFPYNIWE